MIKKFIAGIFIALMSFVGVTVASNAVAGAAPQSCMGPGTSSWVESRGYVYNCSIDGNHVVMDMYQGSNMWPAAVQFYWPSHRTAIQFVAGSIGGGVPMKIRNCPISGLSQAPIVLPVVNNGLWGWTPPGGGAMVNEGIMWTPHGQAFTYATNYGCPNGHTGRVADLR